jgi:RNA polymerase sigma factor (sigma-70 family)
MKSGINKNSLPVDEQPAPVSDIQLLAGLRDGDESLIDLLYRRYYVMVLRMVMSNSGTEEEAQDVYQDTILVLHDNVKKKDFTLSCGLQTYVYAVARRLWLKQLRRAGRFLLMKEEEERDVVDASAGVEEFLEKEADIARMQDGLVKLGEPCATLLTDFYVRSLNMDEIAEKFGYTNADNAKNQKYKCLQRLKRYFFEKAEAEERRVTE